jgi:hypothetical protein
VTSATLGFFAALPTLAYAREHDREPEQAGRDMKTPKQECEELVSLVVPFAEQMLTTHKEFFPFGATMSPTGEIAQAAGWTGDEHPKSAAVIEVIEKTFREGASRGRFKATALVIGTQVVPPGKSDEQEAVEVRVDHRDGQSLRVLFPYSLAEGKKPQLEDPFAVPGENKIFAG